MTLQTTVFITVRLYGSYQWPTILSYREEGQYSGRFLRRVRFFTSAMPSVLFNQHADTIGDFNLRYLGGKSYAK